MEPEIGTIVSNVIAHRLHIRPAPSLPSYETLFLCLFVLVSKVRHPFCHAGWKLIPDLTFTYVLDHDSKVQVSWRTGIKLDIQIRVVIDSTNLNADIIPRSARSPTPDELSPNVARNFIREGAVCLSTGVSSLNRYMFLFSDLLLIAKPKSGASFKLKLRLPVSELWLQSAIDGVCESTVAPNKSFVVGWPTVSYVATFRTIEEQRAIEGGRTVPIRIIFRDTIQKNSAPLSLPVSNEDDVKSVVNMALQGFGIAGSDVNDFQLWVVSGKENAAYPLMGHEIPFCIKMNHIRQASCNVDSPVTERTEFDPEQVHSRSKCEFILKKKKNSTGRLDVGEFDFIIMVKFVSKLYDNGIYNVDV
eukprot:gene17584-9219_t